MRCCNGSSSSCQWEKSQLNIFKRDKPTAINHLLFCLFQLYPKGSLEYQDPVAADTAPFNNEGGIIATLKVVIHVVLVKQVKCSTIFFSLGGQVLTWCKSVRKKYPTDLNSAWSDISKIMPCKIMRVQGLWLLIWWGWGYPMGEILPKSSEIWLPGRNPRRFCYHTGIPWDSIIKKESVVFSSPQGSNIRFLELNPVVSCFIRVGTEGTEKNAMEERCLPGTWAGRPNRYIDF